MDTQQPLNDGAKEFNYKMEKAEKILSFGVLILFFLSFTNQQSVIFNVLFFGITALIFVYYFIWYRKKPPYVVIKSDEVIINHMPFYKPMSIKRENINKARSSENKIVIEYNDGSETKKTSLIKLFLDVKDQENILSILK
ncbi:MAG: hypothetical protein ACOX7R_02955 [Acetivibrionales bacterium]|jgi:hypothetical protein